MANDSPKKPKVNRTRRRPYQEPTDTSGTAKSGSKKTGASAGKSRSTARKKTSSSSRSSRKPAARSAAKPQAKATSPSPAAQAPMGEAVAAENAAAEAPLTEELRAEQANAGPEPVMDQEPAALVHEDDLRGGRSQKVIRKYVITSAGLGLIPVPILDVASLIPVQIAMVAELADMYDVPFRDNRDRSVLSGILSGLIAHAFATRKFVYLLRTIPMVGPLLGLATFPVLSGAATYAAGRVFKQHFEMGGTLLDFDPEKVKRYFNEQFEKGRQYASNLKSGQ